MDWLEISINEMLDLLTCYLANVMIFPIQFIPQVGAHKHLVSRTNDQQVDSHDQVRETETADQHWE